MNFFFSFFSDSFIAFSGGMAFDKGNQNPCVTVIHGKTTTVLEMEHSIIDFITLCETPWPSGESFYYVKMY